MAEAKFRDAVSEAIYKNVLTEEQRKKLDSPRRGTTQPGRRGRRPGAPAGSGKE